MATTGASWSQSPAAEGSSARSSCGARGSVRRYGCCRRPRHAWRPTRCLLQCRSPPTSGNCEWCTEVVVQLQMTDPSDLTIRTRARLADALAGVVEADPRV